MKKFHRRHFLRIAGAAAGGSFLPNGQIAKTFESIAASAGAEALGILSGVSAAIVGAAALFGGLNEKYDPHERFFGFESPSTTSDEYFKALEEGINKLFQRAAAIVEHIKVLRSHPDEAKNILETASKEYHTLCARNYVIDQRLLAESLTRWIDDPSKTADVKMEDLRKHYISVGPKPFEQIDLVDWQKPAGEIFETIREKAAIFALKLNTKSEVHGYPLVTREEQKIFESFWSFVHDLNEEGFDKSHASEEEALDLLSKKYEISEDVMSYFFDEIGTHLPWVEYGEGNSELHLTLDEKPEQVLHKIQNAVRAIPKYYARIGPNIMNPLFGPNANHDMFYEMVERLPAFVAEVVPRMTRLHFPEDVIRAAEEQAVRERTKPAERLQNRQALQAAEKPALRSPHVVSELLLNQEFGNRLWTDRHKGRIPLKNPAFCS